MNNSKIKIGCNTKLNLTKIKMLLQRYTIQLFGKVEARTNLRESLKTYKQLLQRTN